MRVLVIGANGQTGRRIVKRLQDGPHTPVAMIRNPDQEGHFEEMGVATVVGDLEEPLDAALEASAAELDYTIVRPGRLTSDEGEGNVDMAPDPDSEGSISRDDVAAVMVACLDEQSTIRASFDLLTGPTPIAEALASL